MQLEQMTPTSDDLPQPDPRTRLSAPITVLRAESDGPKTFFGYAKNLSRSGMLIGTTNPKEPGSRFRLEIPLPKPLHGVATCTCVVVWCKTWNKKDCHEPGMGLRFLDLSPDVAETIDAWVRERNETQLLWN